MKQIIIAFFCLLFAGSLTSQVVRDHRTANPGKESVVNISPASSGAVILYENGNFAGQSKSFVAGTYRFFTPADLNDIVSSIKVPAGMAVVVYEHANSKGGYGNYIDLMEDCPDLTVYNLNDKVSYLIVLNAARPGFYYARGRMTNNQFVAGHWERERANGQKPDNAPPGTVSILPPTLEADDIANAPLATQAEIDEFENVQKNQLNVGVLGGETTRPFYFHHNKPGEEVYKYKKVIDPARLPGKFFDWASEKLGWVGFVVTPYLALTELATEVVMDFKDWLFGSSSTKMEIDCWYPDSEFKRTVCGKMEESVEICTQDYSHTKVTLDKDVCYNLLPSEKFVPMLTNKLTGETYGKIEGEVRPLYLTNLNTSTGKTSEGMTPRNPLLMQINKDENVCLYGPWMADILDINLKVPVPFTDESLDIGNIDLRKANEIHPVNQLWRKNGTETQLIAIADGTGYFQKVSNNEVAASGLNQRMRFYIAFTLPAKLNPVTGSTPVYDINGVGFEFTDNPVVDIQPEMVTLKYNDVVRIKVNDNSFVRLQKTHSVFFDKVRKRANGSVQGYIVVETERITKPGGSINIFVKDLTVNNSPLSPERPVLDKRQ